MNTIFLAYCKLNLTSRIRLQKLRSSLEKSSIYPHRYPEVLPYHPESLTVKGDGIWLNKTTFLMFLINASDVPTEHCVVSHGYEFQIQIQKVTWNIKIMQE